MAPQLYLVGTTILIGVSYGLCSGGESRETSTVWTEDSKTTMRLKVHEMFHHAYDSYMNHAYPADELMPLSCKGRYRGSEVDRGDIDEALGNFSLTLVDALDTLVVLGDIAEFERATKLVIEGVNFDTDVVVSVFETNIRILGGLLGAHTLAVTLRESGEGMLWYKNDLVEKAVDIGDRLLVAFNTSTGIPFPKVNLKYGIYNTMSRVGHEQDTCTACAGTMIMEFAALSRYSGNPIYEEKAHKAMEAIWRYRSRHSDLVGTVINIHNGDWVRRDSGVGAGIDSYYEYCLKAYVLLGDESYLAKFNKHYSAINKYIRQGSMMLDVLMHQPDKPVRTFMDALQAFWPGLQVLLGDLKPAIETHELLYEVAKRHKFIPEAFTASLDVYWGQHPLRPELAESTYFLYEATKDPYYLDVGKHIIEAMENYARVPCGFAAVKDVRTLSHEDKMDSFVLAETFKYLYLLFSDEHHRIINVHDYLFTTEAHLLPLTLSNLNSSGHSVAQQPSKNHSFASQSDEDFLSTCPNRLSYPNIVKHTEEIRKKVRLVNQGTCSNTEQRILETYITSNPTREPKLRAEHFQVGNKDHLTMAKEMGITITLTQDGRVQLMHQAALATTPEDAQDGIKFMQEMIQLAKSRGDQQGEIKPRVVQILSPPYKEVVFTAGAAQFGPDFQAHDLGLRAEIVEAVPLNACSGITNKEELQNRIVLIERGDCMFIDKVRQAQNLGALGVVIIDHNEGTSSETQPTFAMSGDNHSTDVYIPSVFLFRKEGQLLRKYLQELGEMDKPLLIRIAAKATAKEQPAIYVSEPEGNYSSDSSAPQDKTSTQTDSPANVPEETSMKTENKAVEYKSKEQLKKLVSHGREMIRTATGKKEEKQYCHTNIGRESTHTSDPQTGSAREAPFCLGSKEEVSQADGQKPNDQQKLSSSVEDELRAIHKDVERAVESLKDASGSNEQSVTDDKLEDILGLNDVQDGAPNELGSSSQSEEMQNTATANQEHIGASEQSEMENSKANTDQISQYMTKVINLNEEYDKANAAKIKLMQENSEVMYETSSESEHSETSTLPNDIREEI